MELATVSGDAGEALGNVLDTAWFVVGGLCALVLTAWMRRDTVRWRAAAGLCFAACAVAIVGGRAWEKPGAVWQFLLIAVIGVPIVALADRYLGGKKRSDRTG